MGVVVQKYGGSSVADVDKIRRVAARIVNTHKSGHPVVAVVSAMGKTTDELIRLARQVSSSPGRRELDMLVSVGERISMTLLAMAIADLGVEAISFTGSQSGIITDNSHFNARILEVRPHRIIENLEKGRVVIVAGYQGVSLDKEVTTLGRGGTDTTAIALAAALGADHCEICSDVDGVYTGDPRVITDAMHIDLMSYDEVLALARAGARVLAAEAVEYARLHGIEIRAASTFDSPTRFTRVVGEAPRRDRVVVAGDTFVMRISWQGPAAEVPAVLGWLGEVGVVPHGMRIEAPPGGPAGERVLTAWFRTVNVPDLPRVRSVGLARFGAALVLDERYGTVTAVGERVATSPEGVALSLTALAEGDVAVHGAESASAALTLVIDREQVPRAQQLLHARLNPPAGA